MTEFTIIPISRWPRCEFIDHHQEHDEPCGKLARWSNGIGGGGVSFWCAPHMVEVSAMEENLGVEFNELNWKGKEEN